MDSNITTINDPIHKTIGIHPLCLKIIDTPEFQRLRNIKQCGINYLVYPSAVHTRFEHSIGVYYLAGLMVDSLVKKCMYSGKDHKDYESQPTITEEEKLCVLVAALCHDLGHGPFSHLWERFVNKKVKTKKFLHEDMSISTFQYLIENNNLKDEFLKYNLDDTHIELIKHIITGNHTNHSDKIFLFEIVANKMTNIDVDRWDYMLRDAYFFGVICPLEYHRILCNMKIRKTENRIEFRDKLKDDLLQIFQNRVKLHKICYQHRVCQSIEIMMIDAFNEADDVFLIDRELKLSNAHEDIQTYLTLTDGLIYNILNSNNQRLKKSKDLLLRIFKRQFYQLIHEENLKTKLSADFICDIKESLEKSLQTDLRLSQVELSMGTESNNPFQNVLFYSKTGNERTLELPEGIQVMETKLYIFSVNEIDEKRVEETKKLLSVYAEKF